MWYIGNYVAIEMTRREALSCSHAGQCDDDVREVVKTARNRFKWLRINPDAIRRELREFGAWDDAELADEEANIRRLVWVAACQIREDVQERGR